MASFSPTIRLSRVDLPRWPAQDGHVPATLKQTWKARWSQKCQALERLYSTGLGPLRRQGRRWRVTIRHFSTHYHLDTPLPSTITRRICALGVANRILTVNVSQKSRYALKAVLELSFRFGQGPISISQIAKAQAIPARFLEAILAQLKRGVRGSRRGNEGGYILARPPAEVSVGDVLQVLQGQPLSRCALTTRKPSAACWGLRLRQVVGACLRGCGGGIQLDELPGSDRRYRPPCAQGPHLFHLDGESFPLAART